MKYESETPAPTQLTRRDALLRTLTGVVLTAAAAPSLTQATPPLEPSPAPPLEFVPENDYPFFGAEPSARP